MKRRSTGIKRVFGGIFRIVVILLLFQNIFSTAQKSGYSGNIKGRDQLVLPSRIEKVEIISNNKMASPSHMPLQEPFIYRSEFDLGTEDSNISKIRNRKRVKRDDENVSQYKLDDFVGDENDDTEYGNVDNVEKIESHYVATAEEPHSEDVGDAYENGGTAYINEISDDSDEESTHANVLVKHATSKTKTSKKSKRKDTSKQRKKNQLEPLEELLKMKKIDPEIKLKLIKLIKKTRKIKQNEDIETSKTGIDSDHHSEQQDSDEELLQNYREFEEDKIAKTRFPDTNKMKKKLENKVKPCSDDFDCPT